MRAATAIEMEVDGEIPVPSSINTRTNATICKATKKKIVGGSSSKNSFLSVVDSLVMKLNCDESCRFHGFCSHNRLGRCGARFMIERIRLLKKGERLLCEPPAVKVILCYWPVPLAAASACCIFF